MAAPAAEFEPDPNSVPTPHWYGWQPAIFDGAAVAQALLGYGLDAKELYVTAGITYFVGPVGVHLYHGRSGNIIVGSALRLGAPGIGAAAGFIADKAGSSGRSDGTNGTVIGVTIGCVVAAVVDDVFNSREMLQFWERETSMTLTPIVSRDTRGLSLVGSF